MSLKGDIKEFSLLDVLQIISQNQKSGILKVSSNEDFFGEIYFYDGKLVDVKIESEDDTLKIGNYLVTKKIITSDKLKELLEKQKKFPLRFGKLLIEEGILDKNKLKEIFKNFLINKLEKILSLEAGNYEFINASIDYNSDEIDPISLDAIILDALKNIDELRLFKKKIENLNIIYKKKEDAIDSVILSNDPKQFDLVVKKGSKLLLNNDAFTVYSLINGHNTINDIIKKTSLGDYLVLKVIFQLINYGLIESSVEVKSVKDKTFLLTIKKLGLIILFVVIIYIFFLNLTNIKVIKNTIIFNQKIAKEMEKRNNGYKAFIDKITTLEQDTPIIYHNPKEIMIKKK
ncbi:DUF4388 domain-containing protein [Deferribacter autotrophicus]|uniref:DUF4388 domain-containing protein n=1 Tax=Deferribacter autotrophicus TaxID=500465 RepID=A0A5A8F4C8_9BACT|nr:DUF4388 domain-containing protein [Deferribacter autotrophicus]KAA0257410.1 DUF4388 domain-containing protein [Deferribacter autotrophicus]